jgi:hypothetical protein
MFGRDVTNCAFSRCGENRVYNWEESQPLVLLGVVLVVRVLFLVGERTLLLHMITYYQDVKMTHTTHNLQKDSHLSKSGHQLSEGSQVVRSSIDFRRDVREILGGDTSGTIHVLIVSILIQVIYWFSDFKIVIGYDPNAFF